MKRFTESHEWVLLEENNATVGITCHAQRELGEIVYIELPQIDRFVKAGEEVAVLESTKAAVDIYAPLSGTITAINESLKRDITSINLSPEEKGWIFKIEPSDPQEINQLLYEDRYLSLTRF
jgi:glycine cleavage system H protein